MPLKTGIWKLNVNGFEMTLFINTVDNQGRINGTLNQAAIDGIWDENSQKIIFAQRGADVNAPTESIIPIIYKGYLFKTPLTPAPGEDIVWTLAGSMETVTIEQATNFGGSARRNQFGWFAQINEVI